MAELKLLLLGPPQVALDGEPIEINRRKAIALLAYLAVTQQDYHRDTLAALLWPEANRSRARASLRQTLWELSKALGELGIETKGETLILPGNAKIWVDVHAFNSLLAEGQTHGHPANETCSECLPPLIKLVNLYRDDFLAGFSLPDSPAFDEWQYLETESLRLKFATALEQLGHYYITAGDFEAAIPYVRRWSALDPLLDTPHYILIQLYAWTGQRTAAMRQYRKYVQLLEQELGLDPREDISTLYQRIRRGEEGPKTPDEAKNHKSNQAGPAQPPPISLPELRLGQQDEIRLATVLVAGLSNATNTTWNIHPEQMAGAANSLLQIVTEVVLPYEAQIDRFAGDSVQVNFGILRLHEDDPERAIRAALEIQRLAQQQGLSLTIGISAGEVYLGTMGAAPSQRGAALGPVVNLASRLQDRATAGQVVVSATAYRHTQRIFEFTPFLLNMRGLVEPVTVYEVKQALPHPEKMRGIEGLRARLIGRDEEFQKLKFALNEILAGQGQLISLIGEAGLGKSRLVQELKQIALTLPGPKTSPLWLESRCLELRSTTGYWPFIELLQTYLYQCGETQPGLDRTKLLTSLVEEMAQRDDLSGGATRAEEVVALLSNLLSLNLKPDWVERLKQISPERVPYQTFLAIYDFLVALARRQPLVLVFEDLHWADDLSLDLISLLMEAVPSNPILLLCVYRPLYQHKGLRFSAIASRKCPEQYTEISLRELTREQSSTLIKSLLAIEVLPPLLGEPVLKQTRGNPFFMEEAIRALIEAGILYLDTGQTAHKQRWLVRDDLDSALVVPESVQSVILSRVDRLEPTLKQILRAAAVIGYNFPTGILAQIVLPGVDLEKMLWGLEETALIYREKVVPEEEYAFKHILTQESVYQIIPPQQRAQLHQQVAEAMEQRYQAHLSHYYEQLAYHYSRAQMAEKAVDYLCQAGEKSRRAYLYNDAIHYFKQTLKQLEEIPAPTPGRATLNQSQLTALAGLSQIYHRQGKETLAQDYLCQAITIGQETGVDKPTLIRLYHLLSEVYHWQGRLEEQAAIGQAGLALLGTGETETVEAALMNQAIAIARFKQGNLAQFYALTDQTARFIQKLPYLEELRPAYFHIATSLYYRKRIEQVDHWFRIVEGWAKQHDDQRVLAEIYDFEWGHRLQSGDLGTAITQAEPILELYRKIGHDRRRWRCLEDLAWACILVGDFPAATKYAEQALEVAEALGFDAYQAASQLNLGMVWLCQQSWKKAVTALQKTGNFPTEGIFLWTEWVAHYCLGQIYRAQGRRKAALGQFQMALELFQPYDVPIGWWLDRWPLLTCILSGLETMYELTNAESNSFKAFCRRFESLKKQPAAAPLPGQWYLEAVDLTQLQSDSENLCFADTFGPSLAAEWEWQDPFADCALSVQEGLEIHAANGRDLWHLNLSAPRLLRPAAGDFTIQTVCRAVESNLSGSRKPAIGGLLVWRAKRNFLRLVWGCRGEREITFEGCIENENIIVGRGLLPSQSARTSAPVKGSLNPPIFLRLTRRGNQLRAFCSADGQQWFTVGQVDFATPELIKVGLHAVGWIDRLVYPGSHSEGTAIRFDSFELWK